MKAVIDTNVLVRLLTDDTPAQTAEAQRVLDESEAIVLTLPMLCEFAWVLGRSYRLGSADVAHALRQMAMRANAVVNRPAVEAGLAILDAGGEFADGVIAYEGRRMGGDAFVSFDRRAVQRLQDRGGPAHLLG